MGSPGTTGSLVCTGALRFLGFGGSLGFGEQFPGSVGFPSAPRSLTSILPGRDAIRRVGTSAHLSCGQPWASTDCPVSTGTPALTGRL